MPWLGTEPTPRYVPCLGSKGAMPHTVGWCPTNWATLAKAQFSNSKHSLSRSSLDFSFLTPCAKPITWLTTLQWNCSCSGPLFSLVSTVPCAPPFPQCQAQHPALSNPSKWSLSSIAWWTVNFEAVFADSLVVHLSLWKPKGVGKVGKLHV